MYPTELGVNWPRPDRTGFFTSGDPTESSLSQIKKCVRQEEDKNITVRRYTGMLAWPWVVQYVALYGTRLYIYIHIF
eukprot:SAG31_NODE_146_length_22601_cov_56.529192_16_plen_77_part_00